jgi:hypothetical protein
MLQDMVAQWICMLLNLSFNCFSFIYYFWVLVSCNFLDMHHNKKYLACCMWPGVNCSSDFNNDWHTRFFPVNTTFLLKQLVWHSSEKCNKNYKCSNTKFKYDFFILRFLFHIGTLWRFKFIMNLVFLPLNFQCIVSIEFL